MAKLTKSQIFDAIKAIQDNGDKPTSKLLLDYLGSGSFTTITKYLREYEQENTIGGLEGLSLSVAIPSQLQQSLSSFANSLWSIAQRSAEESVEHEKQQYEDLKQQNHKQLTDAISFAEQRQCELEKLMLEVVELKESANELKAQLDQEKISSVKLETEAKFLRESLDKSDLIQRQWLSQLTGENYLSSDVKSREVHAPISLTKLKTYAPPF